jgi:hypothetical protein
MMQRTLNQGASTITMTAGLVVALSVGLWGQTVETIATGLDNPRGLTFGPEGALYVVEAGRGGPGPCTAGPEGTVCYGPTGAITRIDLRSTVCERVATGLPSLAVASGIRANGPHDISFVGRGNAAVVIGFVGDPRSRADLGAAGSSFGHLASVPASGNWRLTTDLGLFEAAVNPTGDEIDSNPYAVIELPGKQIVVDAGANDLLQVDANGRVVALATFPDRLVPAPPFLGLPPGTQIPMDAVPTSVALGRDGSFYVAQLTGFPFPVGGANIYRVPVAGGVPEVYATGFTAIIDLAWGPDGSLYVLEIAKNGLLAGFGSEDWAGALIRVAPNGTRTEIAPGQFTAPGGVAVGPDGVLYITDNGIYAGTGTVLRVRP